MKQIDERRLKKLVGQLEEFIDALTEDIDEPAQPDIGPQVPALAGSQGREEGRSHSVAVVPPKSLAKADQAKRDKQEL